MPFISIRALLALLTTATLLPVATARQAAQRVHRHRAFVHPHFKLPEDYTQWTRVATCESGGWQVLGGAYPDSLGISRANFVEFGGEPQPPGPASLVNRLMQIRAADRLIAHYHSPIPDQFGCGAW